MVGWCSMGTFNDPWCMANYSQPKKINGKTSINLTVVIRSTGTVLTTSFTKGTRFSTVTTLSLVEVFLSSWMDQNSGETPHVFLEMATCHFLGTPHREKPGKNGGLPKWESACPSPWACERPESPRNVHVLASLSIFKLPLGLCPFLFQSQKHPHLVASNWGVP